jgi:hypothetical protein
MMRPELVALMDLTLVPFGKETMVTYMDRAMKARMDGISSAKASESPWQHGIDLEEKFESENRPPLSWTPEGLVTHHGKKFRQRGNVKKVELSFEKTMALVEKDRSEEAGAWDHVYWNCQNGEEECASNKIQGCAIKAAGSAPAAFPFLTCLMNKGGVVKFAEPCARENKLDPKTLHACFDGKVGEKLEWAAALKTAEAVTSLDFFNIPWVTIDSHHMACPHGKCDLESAVCEHLISEATTLAQRSAARLACPKSEMKLASDEVLWKSEASGKQVIRKTFKNTQPCLNGGLDNEVEDGWKGEGLGKHAGKVCECHNGLLKCRNPTAQQIALRTAKSLRGKELKNAHDKHSEQLRLQRLKMEKRERAAAVVTAAAVDDSHEGVKLNNFLDDMDPEIPKKHVRKAQPSIHTATGMLLWCNDTALCCRVSKHAPSCNNRPFM